MLKTLWLTLTQYLVVLMPIAIFAVMHAARYTRKVIEVSDTELVTLIWDTFLHNFKEEKFILLTHFMPVVSFYTP